MTRVKKMLCLIGFSLFSTPLWAECDELAGKRQYNKCIACHSVEPGVQLAGPSLHGLLGRKVGSEEGFPFSEDMENAGFTWTQETLDAFLEDPMSYIPGSVMPFGGIKKAEQRLALICYIKQLK